MRNLLKKNREILPFQKQTKLDELREKWPEIMSHMTETNHIDSLSYSMYLKPMKPDAVNVLSPSCWQIVVKMEDFDKHLDTYVELKYSEAIRKSVMDILGVECTFKLYSEGCKGSSGKHSIKRALSVLFSRTHNGFTNSSEINLLDAMELFKISSLNNIDKESLRHQRNELLKIYHPDSGKYTDSFAEKINNAYDLLMRYVA